MKKIDKVVFSSDVVNDNDHVYFPLYENEFFALARFPLFDNIPLKDSIRKAVRDLKNEYIFPSVVFIPLSRYMDAVGDETQGDVLGGRCLSFTCKYLNVQMLVMTPDGLKDKVKIP